MPYGLSPCEQRDLRDVFVEETFGANWQCPKCQTQAAQASPPRTTSEDPYVSPYRGFDSASGTSAPGHMVTLSREASGGSVVDVSPAKVAEAALAMSVASAGPEEEAADVHRLADDSNEVADDSNERETAAEHVVHENDSEAAAAALGSCTEDLGTGKKREPEVTAEEPEMPLKEDGEEVQGGDGQEDGGGGLLTEGLDGVSPEVTVNGQGDQSAENGLRATGFGGVLESVMEVPEGVDAEACTVAREDEAEQREDSMGGEELEETQGMEVDGHEEEGQGSSDRLQRQSRTTSDAGPPPAVDEDEDENVKVAAEEEEEQGEEEQASASGRGEVDVVVARALPETPGPVHGVLPVSDTDEKDDGDGDTVAASEEAEAQSTAESRPSPGDDISTGAAEPSEPAAIDSEGEEDGEDPSAESATVAASPIQEDDRPATDSMNWVKLAERLGLAGIVSTFDSPEAPVPEDHVTAWEGLDEQEEASRPDGEESVVVATSVFSVGVSDSKDLAEIIARDDELESAIPNTEKEEVAEPAEATSVASPPLSPVSPIQELDGDGWTTPRIHDESTSTVHPAVSPSSCPPPPPPPPSSLPRLESSVLLVRRAEDDEELKEAGGSVSPSPRSAVADVRSPATKLFPYSEEESSQPEELEEPERGALLLDFPRSPAASGSGGGGGQMGTASLVSSSPTASSPKRSFVATSPRSSPRRLPLGQTGGNREVLETSKGPIWSPPPSPRRKSVGSCGQRTPDLAKSQAPVAAQGRLSRLSPSSLPAPAAAAPGREGRAAGRASAASRAAFRRSASAAVVVRPWAGLASQEVSDDELEDNVGGGAGGGGGGGGSKRSSVGSIGSDALDDGGAGKMVGRGAKVKLRRVESLNNLKEEGEGLAASRERSHSVAHDESDALGIDLAAVVTHLKEVCFWCDVYK